MTTHKNTHSYSFKIHRQSYSKESVINGLANLALPSQQNIYDALVQGWGIRVTTMRKYERNLWTVTWVNKTGKKCEGAILVYPKKIQIVNSLMEPIWRPVVK